MRAHSCGAYDGIHHIRSFELFLEIEATINLWDPGVALGPRAGSYCGISWIPRVLHLGSRLRLATGAPARGGVRVRPTLAKVGRAKRSFSTGFIRVLAKCDHLAETLVFIRDSGMCVRSCLCSVQY